MMTKSTPWDEIGKPSRDYNVRLVNGCGAVPLYWGKDPTGKCVFVVELVGDHAEVFRQSRVSVHGIRVDLRLLNATNGQCLVLALEQHVDRDLFFSLCKTLASALNEVSDSDVAFSIAITHLQRWKSFFANRKQRLLSPEEIRGLFAELQFLKSLYDRHTSEAEAINSWCGPDRAQQDFVFGNTAVEVKAISRKDRNTVRISSEDQLESLCDNLFLEIFRLSDLPDAGSALSLNQAVVEIYQEFSDSVAIEAFSQKLAAYGYVELRDYDEPLLVVSERRTYKVESAFPRLIRSELPQGIRKVGYEIEIEKLARFECSEEDLWGRY